MNVPAIRRSACLIVLGTAACNSSGEQASRDTAVSAAALQPALAAITSDNILQHINRLASDEFEGRGPGRAGEEDRSPTSTEQFGASA